MQRREYDVTIEFEKRRCTRKKKNSRCGAVGNIFELTCERVNSVVSYDMHDVVCFPSAASRATVNLGSILDRTVCRLMLVMGRAENVDFSIDGKHLPLMFVSSTAKKKAYPRHLPRLPSLNLSPAL